jgi:phosphate transport system substrate-binding protein
MSKWARATGGCTQRGKWASSLLGVLLLALVSCARTPTLAATPATLTLASSTAAQPLLESLAQGFQRKHPSVTVIVEGHNSARALAKLAEGTVALAAVTGVPPEGMWAAPEGAWAAPEGIWAAPIAVDGIAMIVHADNPLPNLTLAQAYDVFGGRVWHWSELEVQLPVDEITVVSREAGSGTRATFEALVMTQGPGCTPVSAIELGAVPADSDATPTPPPCEADPVTSMAVVQFDSAGVAQFVADHPQAIGYLARGYLTLRENPELPIRAVRVEDISPAPESIADGSYRLSLPLFLVSPDEPDGVARQFVDYCLSTEGQALVAQEYVPVRAD